ncbi:PQQ-binding-like beta-propeller repeat protein [Zavarzinella formosa]|uniref:PQQ-binding-like beta-propeller repeat protein n=1 Tax=Zavarzinella formosa TaxID=360055 RepID=UPI0002EEA72C|nr:PQQ-binding-like beta-propeller repeat protein [Zavarzinella formosa]
MKSIITLTASAVFALTLCGAEPAPTDNWPTWRGPASNGVAPAGANPPTTWDAKTNIKWKAPLTGRGSATPIVWGDQVIVLTAVETDRVAKADELPKVNNTLERKTTAPSNFYRFEVISFDRATGKVRWKQIAAEKVPHEGHHETHSYAAGSPTTDGKRLYVSFGSFGIYAYDLEGKQLWARDIGRIVSRLGWGEAVTPVIHGDTLLLNWDQEIDSKLIALDAATGKTKWEVKREEKTSWNTPLVVEYAGKTQVILNGTNKIRSYDIADGKVIWECGGMTVNAIPSPLAADGVAFVLSGYRGAAAVAIPLDATGDITGTKKVLWSYAKGTPYVPSPILYEGRLYFTSANTQMMTVLDAKTGKALVSNERLPASSFYGSPVAAAGRVYFTDRSGTTVVVKAGDAPSVISVNKLNDPVDASPVIAGKTLFLRGEKFLYAIEEK